MGVGPFPGIRRTEQFDLIDINFQGPIDPKSNKLYEGDRHNMPPPAVTLTFDFLTLKVVSESRVTWATFVPILVFLGLSVLDLGPMHATDRRQTASSLNAPAY